MISLDEIKHALDSLENIYECAEILLVNGDHDARAKELEIAASVIRQLQEDLGTYWQYYVDKTGDPPGDTYTSLAICLGRGEHGGIIWLKQARELLAEFAIEHADFLAEQADQKARKAAEGLRKKVTLPGGETTRDRAKFARAVCLAELKVAELPRKGSQGVNQAILEQLEVDGAQCTERQIADVRQWLRKMGKTKALKILGPKPA